MKKKKFGRQRKKIKLPSNLILSPNRKMAFKDKDQQVDHEFTLSEIERIRYTYTRNILNRITTIICVSYDLNINNEWVTIIYYDSEHGFLHRHETISMENRNDIVTEESIKKKGNVEVWLTWAIKDILKSHVYYRNLFLKRSSFNIDNL